MKNEIKDNKFPILSSILFLVLGLILFINPDSIIKIISYVMGGVLILVGVYRCFNYYIQDKRLHVVNYNELAFGITAIVLGIIFICLAGAIALLLRLFIGFWVIIAGVKRIMLTFYTTNRDNKFYALIVVGLLLIGLGLYTVLVSNLEFKIIGLFMILYSIINLVSVFVYKDEFKSEEASLVRDLKKEAKVIEGEAEEISEEVSKETKKIAKKSENKNKKSK